MLRERLIDEPNAISTGHANPRLYARAYYGKFINGLAVAEIRREQNQACLGYAEQASHHEIHYILAEMRRTIEQTTNVVRKRKSES